jgi:predicted RNA binding protein YcfA (HicA-like mRNA interferase family)
MNEGELQEFKEIIKEMDLEQIEATLIKAGFKLTREGNKRIYKKPGGKITIQPTEEET